MCSYTCVCVGVGAARVYIYTAALYRFDEDAAFYKTQHRDFVTRARLQP